MGRLCTIAVSLHGLAEQMHVAWLLSTCNTRNRMNVVRGARVVVEAFANGTAPVRCGSLQTR